MCQDLSLAFIHVSSVLLCTVRARVGSNFLELAVEELSFWHFISKLFN